MESKHADPEPEAAPAPEPPAAQPAAAPDAAVAADEGDEVQVLESPPPRNGPVGAKTALGLMAAAVAKERAKPAAGVAKPVPEPKRKASIPMPDGLSPEMRMCNAFAAKASAAAGLTNPFAGSGATSLEDLERLNQKKQEEIERLKRKAARIRAEGAKEQAEHEAYMNEEMRKEDERKKKQKRDAALKRAGCLVDRLRNASSRK